jgi:membrane associated rhomboid family serine protease
MDRGTVSSEDLKEPPLFPLRDDIPTHSVPIVNYAIIAACALVFFVEASSPDGGERIVFQYGMTPARVTGQPSTPMPAPPPGHPEARLPPLEELPAPPFAPWLTLFTCMFLHGGLMHIVGNMWFLYIFGDNVEDRYGHVGYALMYIGSGLAAGLLHLLSSPSSPIPTVGASGAIAGVMGAYFLMFRHAQVMTLIPLGIFTQLVAIPAPFFLGLWFLFQLLSAAGSDGVGGGVAWWAHVGGFAAGLGVTWLLGLSGNLPRSSVRVVPTRPWHRRRIPWE